MKKKMSSVEPKTKKVQCQTCFLKQVLKEPFRCFFCKNSLYLGQKNRIVCNFEPEIKKNNNKRKKTQKKKIFN